MCKINVTMQATRSKSRTTWTPHHAKWFCKLYLEGREIWRGYYHQPKDNAAPDAKTVYDCVYSDAMVAENNTLREFVKDEVSGCDRDPFEAIALYKACKKTHDALAQAFPKGIPNAEEIFGLN